MVLNNILYLDLNGVFVKSSDQSGGLLKQCIKVFIDLVS